MPSLNSRGQILMGRGGVRASVGGVLLPIMGGDLGAGWFDDDSVVGQSLNATQILLVDLAGNVLKVLAGHGANAVVAGGDRWASFLAPDSRTGAPSHVDGSLGPLPGASILAANDAGTIAWRQDYHAPAGMMLSDPSGNVTPVPSAVPIDVQVIDSSAAIWYDGKVIQAIGVPQPKPALPSEKMRRVEIGPEVWLVYWSPLTKQVIAQIDGADEGYTLTAPGALAYNRDAANINGELVVCWSVTSGEGPGDDRSVLVDRTKPRVPLAAEAVQPTFAFDHPVILVVFKPQATTRVPDIMGLGHFTEAADPTADIAQAIAEGKRVLCLKDGPGPWSPPPMPASSLRLRELYFVDGENPSNAPTRWLSEIWDLLADWPGDVGVVPMFYCQGGLPGGNPPELYTVAQVLAGQRWLSAAVNLSPRIKVIAPFEDDRGNGMRAHVEFRESFAALILACAAAGVATLTTMETPAPIPVPAPNPAPVPSAPPQEPAPMSRPYDSLTDAEKTAVCDAIGTVIYKAFPSTGSVAQASQGARQAIDQQVSTLGDLAVDALARAGGATPDEVALAAAKVVLLQPGH